MSHSTTSIFYNKTFSEQSNDQRDTTLSHCHIVNQASIREIRLAGFPVINAKYCDDGQWNPRKTSKVLSAATLQGNWCKRSIFCGVDTCTNKQTHMPTCPHVEYFSSISTCVYIYVSMKVSTWCTINACTPLTVALWEKLWMVSTLGRGSQPLAKILWPRKSNLKKYNF